MWPKRAGDVDDPVVFVDEAIDFEPLGGWNVEKWPARKSRA
jgi:hypothetical protein